MSKTMLPADFAITPEMRAWAREKMPGVNIDFETEAFCDHFRGHGKRMCDWIATWRNWIRRAPEFARGGRNQRSMAPVEMPYVSGERTPGPPVQLRDHPLFRGLKSAK